MSFVYPQVLISSQPYSVYGDLSDALLYLNASVTATNFLSSTEMLQSQLLVSAVRWLESVTWLGKKADSTDELQWPRSGLNYVDGTAVDDSTIPVQVVNAEFELAAALADDPDLRNTLQSPIPRELRAGSVEMQFFRPWEVQIMTPFPTNVMALIGIWLVGIAGAGGPLATGTCARPEINKPLGFDHGI